MPIGSLYITKKFLKKNGGKFNESEKKGKN